jgi:exodeoxyribonuclease VII large subunit
MTDPTMLDLFNLPDQHVSVSDFIDLLNETFAFGYPSIVVTGELANLRVSRGRWLYFDLKDETSSLKCFGTVGHLPGPLEDGMLLEVRGAPRMHNLYGFSFNVQIIKPSGEGSLRRAAELLHIKLQAEGLFDTARKRSLPYPPQRIGLVTSLQSAAYADFTKILAARWGGIEVRAIDVQVQGEVAPQQIVGAIKTFNELQDPPEVLVLVRGGGSADDLAAFSTEQVTRAVAASRIPTLVAIGHEIDVSLAELAADVRASTPSNAAELLTPDKAMVLRQLASDKARLYESLAGMLAGLRMENVHLADALHEAVALRLKGERDQLAAGRQLLRALSPQAALQRGYAIVRSAGGKPGQIPKEGAIVHIDLLRAQLEAKVMQVTSVNLLAPGKE